MLVNTEHSVNVLFSLLGGSSLRHVMSDRERDNLFVDFFSNFCLSKFSAPSRISGEGQAPMLLLICTK